MRFYKHSDATSLGKYGNPDCRVWPQCFTDGRGCWTYRIRSNNFDFSAYLMLLYQLHSLKQWLRGLRRGSAAARFWDCGFESRRGHGCLSVVCVMCCQVEVSATGRSLVQRNPAGCMCVCVCVCLIVCDLETSTTRWPRPDLGCCTTRKEKLKTRGVQISGALSQGVLIFLYGGA
jgi:hypothetical protein